MAKLFIVVLFAAMLSLMRGVTAGTIPRLMKAAAASACGFSLLSSNPPAIANDALSAAFRANSEMKEKKALPEKKDGASASASDRAKQREAVKQCRALGIGDAQKECLAKLLPPSPKDLKNK